MIDRIIDGRTDLVFDYLASGFPADSKDDHGVSLIRWCAYYGDVSAIRYLVSNGENLHSLGHNYDLNGAVFHGHWRLCQYLIEQGADVNYPLEESGETPLHAATCTPDRPAFEFIVKILLAAGANPNSITKKGTETGSFMRDARTYGETPLHRAAAFGTEPTIRMLVEAGAKVDFKDMNGDTPLSWASYHQRPAFILEMLCFEEHRIHPIAVDRSRSLFGMNWRSMENNLLGEPHVQAKD